MRSTVQFPFLLLLALGSLVAPAVHAENKLTFGTGLDYSYGKYGDTVRTETFYVPFSAKYEVSDWTFRATVPYVESIGPATVSGSGVDRVALDTNKGSRHRASGLGDVVVGLSWTALEYQGWLLDFGSKAKLATANKNEGLGTGKNDYSVQTDVYRSQGALTLFGTLGYKRMGDPEGVDLRNPLFISLGSSYKASSNTSLGLSYDFRQNLRDGGQPMREVTGFLSYRMDQSWKLQGYLVAGFSDASPDLGVGMMVFYGY